MATTIERRAPIARCYHCGSSAVRALCHHCWRPGCARHVRSAPRWAERLFGTEGTGPGLKNMPAWHCVHCAHVQVGRWLEAGVTGAAVALAGVLTLAVSLVLGAILIAIGGAVVCWSYSHVRRCSSRARDNLPVALHPRVSDLRLTEQLRTRINLGKEGNYEVEADPVSGQLKATLTFDGRDAQRVRHRRNKRKLALGEELRYSAGGLVPRGRIGISELSGNPVVQLGGKVMDVPVLSMDEAPAASQWPVDREYRLSVPPDIDAGPLWITPSIAPESSRRVLELDIQWPEFGPEDGDSLSLDEIELLKIMVPVRWGTVQDVNPGPATVGPGVAEDETSQTIEWTRMLPDEAEHEERKLTVRIQFEEPIAGEDSLSGRLETTMKGTLSGVSGLRMFNALGAPRSVSGTASAKTRIEADFRLSLASIRYQSVRVFPDRVAAEGNHREYVIESDAIPDDETMIALTNALGEEGLDVKRMAENPPRSGGKANIMHRYWDIAGRSYEGVHAVDFHLVVIGEEVHEGDVRAVSGWTKIQISVQGAYTNEEMYKRVENVWTRLRVVTEEALRGRCR